MAVYYPGVSGVLFPSCEHNVDSDVDASLSSFVLRSRSSDDRREYRKDFLSQFVSLVGIND